MSIRLIKHATLCFLLVWSIGACSANDMKRESPPRTAAEQAYDFIDLSGWTPIDELPIDVVFLHSTIGDPQSPYCPRFVNRPFIRLLDWQNRTYVKKIVWRALKQDASPYTDGFSIYFSPFNPMTDGNTGVIESGDIQEAFVTLRRTAGYDVEFKYTIVGDACRRDPLDPRMRVD